MALNTKAFNFDRTMAITINSTRENDTDQTVFFSIDFDGTKKWHADIPKDADAETYLDEDKLKREILRKQYPEADVPQLEGKTELESFEAWISDGCINAEITKTITTPAVEAKPAVMGTRPKMTEVEEEVSKTVIEEVDGKMVQKTVTETVTKSVPETKEVPLFNEDGEEIGTHTIEVTEEYEITPAVEAVEETSETVIVRPESVVEKVAWKDTAE
ncbi:hypothetical protein [uncultured Mediterranean phage uvDeep-CGR2-AD12-C183]|nr:hypothetical protein [uncultured Mediterranean phage uvDeep-CGR2-AD12-C183]